MMEKTCTRCEQKLSLDAFPIRSGKVRSWCRTCESAYQAAYREKNREAILQGKREHYLKNKEVYAEYGAARRALKAEEISAQKRQEYLKNREKIIERSRARYAAKREEILEKQREYSRENSERIRARSKAYISARPELLARMHAVRRRAEKRALARWDSELTEFVSAEAVTLCRLRADLLGGEWHLDHQVPLQGKTVSGLHVWNNFAVVPAKFNRSKKNNFGEHWLGRSWL